MYDDEMQDKSRIGLNSLYEDEMQDESRIGLNSLYEDEFQDKQIESRKRIQT